jgi:hypothetical protein
MAQPQRAIAPPPSTAGRSARSCRVSRLPVREREQERESRNRTGTRPVRPSCNKGRQPRSVSRSCVSLDERRDGRIPRGTSQRLGPDVSILVGESRAPQQTNGPRRLRQDVADRLGPISSSSRPEPRHTVSPTAYRFPCRTVNAAVFTREEVRGVSSAMRSTAHPVRWTEWL